MKKFSRKPLVFICTFMVMFSMLATSAFAAPTSVLGGLGYWDSAKGIFYYSINAPQRAAGYCDLYDTCSPAIGLDIAWIKAIFHTSDGKDWRIEIWKGSYGKIYGQSASSGCEIGVYYRKWYHLPGMYRCADNANTLAMSCSLYHKSTNTFLFSRNSNEVDNYQGRHWWLTGFKPGAQYAPAQLKMHVSITLKNAEMARGFYSAISTASGNKGTSKVTNLSRSGNTVTFDW